MAHQIEQMFSVRETPWHKLGRIVQEAPTAEAAIKLAGLDWTVSKRAIKVLDTTTGLYKPTEDYIAIVRDSDESLYNVGLRPEYTPLQNAKAFEFFNPFIDSGLAKFETAGSLRGGRNVWVLATLNKAPLEIGKGDTVRKFLLLSNGHDGSMAVRVGFTPVRVVCANTLAASHNAKDSQLLRVFHSRQVESNLEKIREIVNAADARFEATADQYRLLARKKLNKDDLKEFVRIVYGFKKDDEDDRKQLAQERITKDIARLFEAGRGSNLETAKGTYWGLYNAVTEHLSYERGRTDDSRLFGLWFGDGAKINQRALEQATKQAVAA